MALAKITVILITYSMACLGAGLLALRLIEKRLKEVFEISAGLKFGTAYILGGGFLANLWLLLSLADWLRPQIVTVIVLILAGMGIFLSRHDLSAVCKQVRSIIQEFLVETWGWKVLIGLTVMTILAWGTSVGGPLSFDGVAKYMTLSKTIAYTHQLVTLPGIEYLSSFGLQGEMHYAALISLGSADAAQLFAWPAVLAGVILLLGLGRLSGLGRRGQWLVIAGLFSSSAVVYLSGSGKVDLFAAAFGWAAYYWVVRTPEQPSSSALWLTGLFTGFAILAKLSYLSFMIPGVGFLFVRSFIDDLKNREGRGRTLVGAVKNSGVILAGILLAMTPHLIKNGLMFNDLLAPFTTGEFGWEYRNMYSEATTRHILLSYPLQLFYGRYWAQIGTLSPLLLAFLPLNLVLPRARTARSDLLAAISWTAVISIVVWIAVSRAVLMPRFILAGLMLIAIPAAHAAEYFSRYELPPRWITAGIIAATCLILLSTLLFFQNRVFFPAKSIMVLSDRISDCERYPAICEVTEPVNRSAGQGTRLFAADYLRYYLRPDLIQCLPSSDEIHAYVNLVTPEQRWNYLLGRGFRYLMIFAEDKVALSKLDLENLPDWVSAGKVVEGEYLLFRLESSDPEHQPGTICRQGNPLRWETYTW